MPSLFRAVHGVLHGNGKCNQARPRKWKPDEKGKQIEKE